MRLFPVEEALDDLDHARNASRTTDHDHFIYFVRRESRIRQRLFHRTDGPLEQVFHQLLELRAGQLGLHVLRPGGVRCQERKIDFRFLQLGKLDFCLLGRFLQPLNGHAILADVNALIALEFSDHPFDDPLVNVVSAEVRVAVC